MAEQINNLHAMHENKGAVGLMNGIQPTPLFLPEKSHGQKRLESFSPWVHQESDMTELLSTRKCYRSAEKVVPFLVKVIRKRLFLGA